MSLCHSGMNSPLNSSSICIEVPNHHPLIQLANTIDWQALSELVLPDLKITARGCWWLGRKLKLRVHLGVYLLQQLFNLTDRGTEQAILQNAFYQVFCGKTVVCHWHCPDHTKIESFRSRLSPKTQCAIANVVAALAQQFGFADPQQVDMDSTVQEPDMQYPAKPQLLLKSAILARRIQKWITERFPNDAKKLPEICLKKIKGIAKEYFFTKRRRSKDHQQKMDGVLKKLWQRVADAILPVINITQQLQTPCFIESLTKSQQFLLSQFTQKAPLILSHIFNQYFEGVTTKSTVFSYFRDAVLCFNKMKHHKKFEFGRQFQIGRIAGNFLFSIPNDSLLMHDASCVKPMIKQHIELFQKPMQSLCTDKGYYSKANEKLALDFGIDQVAIQRPMKSDRTTESSGFCAILGFNLRQMMRCLSSHETVLPT